MNGDSYSSRDGGGGRHHGSSRDHHQSRGGDRDDRRDRDRGDRGDRNNRRRSRSPRPRRDAGGEVDSYSSSRNHREREREDRYAGRDRRERDWDRDRSGRGGDRHNSRRDDHDDGGHGRRGPRDAFDDRRGGPRRDGRDGRDMRDMDRDRRRSATPPPKKREPTPDLTDVISVQERKRRLTQWDMKPPGYDNVTAEQAKLSGMFPLPGAPRQQAVDPTKLQAFMKGPGESGGSGVAAGTLKPTNSRQSKRLIVKGLPAAGTTEEELVGFFNLQLNGLNVIEQLDPCVQAQLSADKSFAVVEFKEATDATVALALDGISMHADDAVDANGAKLTGLEISRPKDYIVPAVVDESIYEPGVVSSTVIDTPNKISVANIPLYLTDEQVTELLVAFGELKAYVLVKDRSTEESRGIAFCEYVESASTEIAIQGLNGMELGGGRLKVRKASVGIAQVAGIEMGVNAMSMLAGTTSLNPDVSRVVQLLNMVTAEELMDNDDYEEILEDVQEECSKFGKIVDVKIPRPVGGSRQSAGVGKIFVKYETTDSATAAMKALAGRKFADRTVVTTYFPEENFEVSAW